MKSSFSIFLFLSVSFLAKVVLSQPTITPVWRHTVKISLNSINKSHSLCVDKIGNCYVLGTTWLADSAKDILLIKFNPFGEEEWQRIYDNPTHGDDIPTSMCLDNEANIWICGIAKTKSNNADFLVVKFTPDGIPVSDELYDGRDHLFDCATSITPGKNGEIYAAGYETSLDSGINMMIVKYKTDGNISWRRTYATRQMDVANQIITDDSSNVYVCGTSNNGPHSGDIIIQKYDPEGKKKWQLIYDGPLSQNDAGQFIATDDSTNIYVTGFTNHVNSRSDIPLLKLNRNGVLLQDNIYFGHIADCGAISLNARRHRVYLTAGCSDYNISINTNFLVEFDKAGKEKFTVVSPEEVQFLKYVQYNDSDLILGSQTTHPESTLIPFIAGADSSALTWTFSDSTVYGLAHITFELMVNNDIYFLGDDTGDATGTISVFKYLLTPEAEKQKIKVIKKGK